jgi:MraZ protein
MPAKFREVLRGIEVDRLYISFFGKHLSAYPPHIWDELQANLHNKITTQPQLNGHLSQYRRYVNYKTVTCNIDKQGRILIPAELRDKAGITREVVLGGNQTVIDIWSEKEYERFEQEMQENFPEMSIEIPAAGF